MARRGRGGDGDRPLTSFGTGGGPFQLAQSGALWPTRGSAVLLVIGLLVLWWGIASGRVGLVVLGALVALVAAAWLAGSVRSALAARRLSRRDP
jgi:Flp pilus assembly protein TadB